MLSYVFLTVLDLPARFISATLLRFGEHILGLFGLHPSSLSNSAGFVFLSGKLHWFLYLPISYNNDPRMFIFCWSSNFVEKVVLNESMAAKMASLVSYLVYYSCI